MPFVLWPDLSHLFTISALYFPDNDNILPRDMKCVTCFKAWFSRNISPQAIAMTSIFFRHWFSNCVFYNVIVSTNSVILIANFCCHELISFSYAQWTLFQTNKNIQRLSVPSRLQTPSSRRLCLSCNTSAGISFPSSMGNPPSKYWPFSSQISFFFLLTFNIIRAVKKELNRPWRIL